VGMSTPTVAHKDLAKLQRKGEFDCNDRTGWDDPSNKVVWFKV
jgi:hypothetical protein